MCAGLPGIVVNTLLGSYAAYGMAGLRNDASSVVLFGLVNVLQAMVAMQVLIACVFLTTNQVNHEFN